MVLSLTYTFNPGECNVKPLAVVINKEVLLAGVCVHASYFNLV
jgi:hypothetical protein